MAEQKPQEITEIQKDEEVSIKQPFKVVLFNDDFHSFDEVINQIIKAIKCGFETARDFAFEAHVKGKAIVFNGTLNECLKVSSILEEIELHTQILS
ncbi:MAG: ATP-dependent Clp protease adaptor protein ClpS [Stygiobacter sp.]|nr:MAG: ATP-dependent Clp protease adaptor protein ClpS [Stygiobacter sp.]KAF0210299.1 MAG: ATP-dependent Clp protease adaptor protein [Ignavibacteria bacterium]